MISDSPYGSGELILRPAEGALAGIAGSLLMLVAVKGVNSDPSGPVSVWLGWLGRPVSHGMAEPQHIGGLVVHGLLGAILGLLYSASQQRIPIQPLLGIGAFYGLLLWIGGRILLGWMFSTPVREVVHSWTWLFGACVYGMTLALSAAWAAVRRPKSAVTVPRD